MDKKLTVLERAERALAKREGEPKEPDKPTAVNERYAFLVKKRPL